MSARDTDHIIKKNYESKENLHYRIESDRNTKLMPSIKIPIMRVNLTEDGLKLQEKFLRDRNLIAMEYEDSLKTPELIKGMIESVCSKYDLNVSPKLKSARWTKFRPVHITPMQLDEMDTLKNMANELSKAEITISEKIYLNKPFSYFLQACFAEKFERLRMDLGISNEYFVSSLKYCTKWISTGGKTESDFFKTEDKKFIAKFITTTEYEMALGLASSYFAYFKSINSSGKKTLLCPILGIYEMKVGSEPTKYLILMNNLFYGFEDRIENLKVYDLKGSRKNRLKKDNLKGKTLMDTNFDLERNGDLLAISGDTDFDFFEVVERDCTFLKDQKIVDYSILLILDETHKIVTCGIIDYLRKYDFIKKLEHNLKKLQYLGEDPTIVNPEVYANRFISSLKKRIVIVQDLSAALE